jgi:hypothetical protein
VRAACVMLLGTYRYLTLNRRVTTRGAGGKRRDAVTIAADRAKQVPTGVLAAPHTAGLETSLLNRTVSLPVCAPHAKTM